MNAIFVEPAFQEAADALLPEFIRLGGRAIIGSGPHAGRLMVNAEIVNSCPEWEAAFATFATGGSALNPDGSLTIEPGLTIEFTGPTGDWGPFEITSVSVEDLAEMFPEVQP